MRLANAAGRLTVVPPAIGSIVDGGSVEGFDVETASDGRFGSDPQAVYDGWDAFVAWLQDAPLDRGRISLVADDLGPVVPRPTQVFAIGLNYAEHAAESDQVVPSVPPTFTKFPTCLAGPSATVRLPEGHVDWEVELVVVVGRSASGLRRSEAWEHVAGVTVGQDISERVLQRTGPAPQFSLAKSFPGFGPMGPALVTVDELDDPDDLALTCSVDGEVMQSARTSMMVFGVPDLLVHLSSVLTLLPGDVIFTGTPSGVGMGRTPPRFLRPGEVIESEIEGIGKLRNPTTA